MRLIKYTILALTLLCAGGMLCAQQQAYDFSYTCPDGQTLFFKITQEDASAVSVVSQYNGNTRYERPPKDRVDIPGQVEWNGRRFVVEAVGDRAFMSCKELSIVVFPASVKSIGTYAFASCTGLVTAELPAGLTVVGSSAFSNCVRLAGPMVIPARVKEIGSYAFLNCSSLTTLQLPDKLEEIGSSAFKGCSGLRGSITITPSVKSIGNSAFADCTHLSGIRFYGCDELHMGNHSNPVFAGCVGIQSVTIGDAVRVLPENAFKGCTGLREMTLPAGLTVIGHSAFALCGSMTGDLIIPAGVTSIGGSAFYGCRSLHSLQLPEGITEIGDYTFYQCSGLEGRLVLPEGLTRIGTAAFKGCSGLTGALALPAGMVHIGNEAFMGCEQLTGTLTIPIGMAYIGQSAFADCKRLEAIEYGAEDCKSLGVTGHTAFHGCTGIRSVTIFSGVKQIPACAFSNCTGVEGTIRIPDGVTTVGSNAFSGCTQVTAILFPSSLEGIRSGAFRGCTRLDGTLRIPASVNNIGNNAFENCVSITAIEMGGFPPRIGNNTFNGVNSIIPVRVPCKSLLAYQNSENWRYFGNIEGSSSENRLTVRSADDSMGTVRIIQNNTCSFAQAIVQAVPLPGYVFSQWADGVGENPRTLVVSSDTLMEAWFEVGQTVAVTAAPNDAALGAVLGSGEYETGDEATLIAVAYVGTTFLGWSDGNSKNPRTEKVRGNVRYTALFALADGSQEAQPSGDEIEYPLSVEEGTITIQGVKGHSVTVYDDYGRQVERRDDCPATFRYKPSTPGNYLVRIDTGDTRRVVISAR